MRPTLVTGTGIALTLASVALYFAPSQLLERFSNAAYDALIRRVAVQAGSDRVAIVDLDEESLRVCGQWPWPRYRVAKMTQALFDAGAAVVVFDVLFAEPDNTSPAQVERLLQEAFGATVRFDGLGAGQNDFDQLFADVLRGKNAVLGCSLQNAPADAAAEAAANPSRAVFLFKGMEGASQDDLWRRTRIATQVQAPLPVLSAAAAGVGSIDADVDSDNVLRRSRLFWGLPGQALVPSLALEALRLLEGRGPVKLEYDRSGVRRVQVGGRSIPTDAFGRILVNFRRPAVGSAFVFPTLPAHRVLSGRIEPSEVADRVVFVGTSATGLLDIKATPLSDGTPGVETHATIVDNVLTGDVLRHPAGMQTLELLAILLTGLALTWAAHRGRAWISVAIVVVVVGLLLGASLLLVTRSQLVFVPAKPLLAVLVIYPVLTSIRFWQEEVQRRRIRNMFGTMVSKDVMRYLEENPESFSLEGRDAEATIFFSDIAGFTSIAEKMTAGEVTQLLNRYLSAMNDVILARKGYVDKYQGDAIMAVWGAPFAMENHAREACLAAIEQKAQTEGLRKELKDRFGVEVHVRMGINSGRVKAGNMGSSQRMQYTVIGDVVNQASRFEPLNKQYGTDILIGEETYILAGRDIEARLVDRIVVKGKTEPANVYELMCRKGQLSERDRMFVHCYETALRSHWERDWEKSLAYLERALSIKPNDISCLNLRVRVQGYMHQPPAMNWSGAFVYTTK